MAPLSRISIHALREEGDAEGLVYDMFDRKFQSTPSARRATSVLRCAAGRDNISIHALREEGDCRGSAPCSVVRHFNPRPPRGGRPTAGGQPTKPSHFNPRPPRGGRPERYQAGQDSVPISIHALREEGDRRIRGISCLLYLFQSTPSARRATEHHSGSEEL